MNLPFRGAAALLRGSCLAALSAIAWIPAPAAAQPGAAPAPSSGAERPDADDEIIVTARKQAESLQSVPIAISVLSADDISASRLFDVSKLGDQVPGLFVGGSQQRGSPVMRGIVTRTPEVGADGSVGQYIDEVYQPRITGQLTALFDLDRIEVLKGPQGTLYGRNTIGGVINYVTRKPGDTFDAYATVGAGNRNAYELRAGVSGPIAESLSAGLSIMARDSDGNIDVVDGAGQDIGNDGSKDFGVRGAVRWTPNDRLEVNASVYNLELRGASLDMASGYPAGPLASFFPQTAPYTDDNAHYRITRGTAGHLDRTISEAAVRADYTLTDSLTLTSLTSYQDYDLDLVNDLDYSVDAVEMFRTTEASETFSQELRLAGGGDVFNWTVGANYFHDDHSHAEIDDLTGSVLLPFLGGAPFPSVDFNVKTTSYALFGQGNFALTDKLTLTAGVRYSADERDYRKVSANQLAADNYDSADPSTFPGITWDTKPYWDNTSYLLSLDYQLTPDVLLYVSNSTGYRSGGIQGRTTLVDEAANNYGPEHLKQYEIGAKTTWLNGRVRLNIAAYDIDYEDAQITQETGSGIFAIISNAASSSSQGVEVEANARLTDNLSTHIAYAHNDSHFTSYTFQGFSYEGVPFESAPPNTWLVALDYDRALAMGPTFGFHIEYAWRDDVLLAAMPKFVHDLGDDFLEANYLQQHAFGLLNASASLSFTKNLSVGLWGRNLTDEQYLLQGGDVFVAFTPGQGQTFLTGDRKTYGVTVNWRY